MKSPRHVALDILIGVETKKRHPDDLLNGAFKKYRLLTDLDKAFITELVYGTLRWQGKIDWVIRRFSDVKPERIERVIFHILRLGIYQLLFLTKVPHRAAVNESVILTKKMNKKEAVAFVNALLRGVIRGGGPAVFHRVEGTVQEVLAVDQAFPLWAVMKLWETWGEKETRAFCQASNQTACLTLRVNTLRTDRSTLMERLSNEGVSVSTTPFSPDGVIVNDAPPVSKVPLLRSGLYQIQDEAAQLISYLVDPKPDEMILDACAAPGSKTTHLAQLMADRGTIYALDLHRTRLRLVEDSCRRMGITTVRVLNRDVTRPLTLGEGGGFDAILTDVPCTGWGTLRRNPDIKWRTTPEDIPRLARIQRRILGNLAGLLKVGGRIVYSTCTVFEEENENVVGGFLGDSKGLSLDATKSFVLDERLFDGRGFFRTLPHCHCMDGFFAVRMVKS